MKNFYFTKVRPKIKQVGRAVGIRPTRERRVKNLPPDLDERTIRVFKAVHEFTMTSPERLQALICAVDYVVENNVDGDFVECGVWRGGSMMAAALILKELGDESRNLYLFDTYEGMSSPTDEDGKTAKRKFTDRQLSEDSSDWCRSPIDDVRQNMLSTGYPAEKIHFIKGKVEDTLPAQLPSGSLALLRLDTDWYESTRHELIHLYPRLASSGVLIIDDYDTWQGSRQAVDEYIAEHKPGLLLSPVDRTARMAVKH